MRNCFKANSLLFRSYSTERPEWRKEVQQKEKPTKERKPTENWGRTEGLEHIALTLRSKPIRKEGKSLVRTAAAVARPLLKVTFYGSGAWMSTYVDRP